MGKKSRAKAGNNESKTDTKNKSGNNNLWVIVGGAVIMVAIVWGTLQTTNKKSEETKPAETASKADKFTGAGPLSLIATLDPEQFTGRAKAAYQAAKEIPAVLAQLPCFCGCMDSEELGHKNNLYCFADSHGNICDLCQTIALEAQDMYHKGDSVETIRTKIRAAYGSHAAM